MDALTDEKLAVRVAGGDHAAYATLVARHADRFLAVAQRVLGNRAEAEDALQDAFVKLWTRAERFDPHTARFTTWFYRIVVNRCLDMHRRRKPEPLPEGFDRADEAPGAEAAIAASDRSRRVQAALAGLPERQRVAVTLCYFEGLSNKEAADVLEVGVKGLESLLSRARAGLRKDLQEEKADLMEPQGEIRHG